MTTELQSSPARSKALFCIFQAGAEADGGVTSITEIVLAVAPVLDVEIVTNRHSDFNRRWRDGGCRVEVLPMGEADFLGTSGDGASRLAARLLNNLRLWRRLGRVRPAFIHCNDQQWFWSAILAAKARRIPVVLNVRDALPPRRLKAPTRWKAAYALCDRFLVLSAEMAAYWSRMLGVREGDEKLTWCYSIVQGAYGAPDLGERAAIRTNLGLGDEAFVVSYVASFNPKKQQAAYIEGAVGPLLDRLPDATFVFVGDLDPEKNVAAARSVAAVDALQAPGRVRFTGFATDPSLWYKASDLIVLASEREGLPRCLIEALCCGTPFVSFDVSSAYELAALDGVSMVVAQGDYGALAEMIARKRVDAPADLKGRVERARRVLPLFDVEAGRQGYLSVVSSYLTRAAR